MDGLDVLDEIGKEHSLEGSFDNFNLSKSQQEYLSEFNVSSEEWEEMSGKQQDQTIHDVRDRLEEIGADGMLEQDKVIKDTFNVEIQGEFRKQVFQEKWNNLTIWRMLFY